MYSPICSKTEDKKGAVAYSEVRIQDQLPY
jgi:hypothetical protein